MAKNTPVIIWIIKHNPNKDPKFHSVEILDGVGRSINELLIILIIGEVLRMGIFISFLNVGVRF